MSALIVVGIVVALLAVLRAWHAGVLVGERCTRPGAEIHTWAESPDQSVCPCGARRPKYDRFAIAYNAGVLIATLGLVTTIS